MDPRVETGLAGIVAGAIVFLIVAGVAVLSIERGPLIQLDLEAIATALCP